MKHLKKISTSIALSLVFLSSPIFASKISNQDVIFDDNKVEITGFNINDNNYYKLRDIAVLLSDSKVNFSVDYNIEKNSIEIYREKNYIKTSDDLKILTESKEEPKKSTQSVIVDGDKISFDVYSIDGYNYFKLRDLGKVIGFYVDYKADTNSIIIKSIKTDPKSLINNQEDIKIIEVKTSSKNIISSLKDFQELSIDDFFKNLTNTILLTEKNGQLPAKEEYDKAKNLITLRPIQEKYKGITSFEPIIRIESKDKSEYFKYTGAFNVEKLLKEKNIDANNDMTISLGYYVGEENSENFRVFSTFSFSK